MLSKFSAFPHTSLKISLHLLQLLLVACLFNFHGLFAEETKVQSVFLQLYTV